MPYAEQPLQTYLDDAASAAPTPGGGSVAALAGALAASMASMVGAFTLSSAKCADAHPRMTELRTETERLRAELARCMQGDIDAYAGVSAAYALPRATDADKLARSTAIRAACRAAMQPPLATMRALAALAELLPEIARLGNRNLVSDTGVAAHLCVAACESARLNVLVNVHALKDDPEGGNAAAETERIRDMVKNACALASGTVDAALGVG